MTVSLLCGFLYSGNSLFLYNFYVSEAGTLGHSCSSTRAQRFYHRVGRVLSFFSSRRNWDSPTPQPQASVPTHPLVLGGVGAHSLAGKGWGSPNSDKGTFTVVLFIYTYFVIFTFIDQTEHPKSESGSLL